MSGRPQTVSAAPDLSVVVACDGETEHLTEVLDAIARACEDIDLEIVVVHPSDTPVTGRAGSISVRSIAAESRLVPVLWGIGIADSKCDVVALTTTQFRVQPGWGKALLDEISRSGLAGVGGRMALAKDADALTRAAFFLRYSEHMGIGDLDQPRDIAGDNAAYVRRIVVRDYPGVANGFWEVDAHRLMRGAGERFGRASNAVAVFDPHFSLADMIRNRFVHGGHYGSYRVQSLGWPRWRAVAVTPLVPFVLLNRIVGRVSRSGTGIGGMLTSLPLILTLLFAWAAGEARGALSATERSAIH